jgi:hypothetical protein
MDAAIDAIVPGQLRHGDKLREGSTLAGCEVARTLTGTTFFPQGAVPGGWGVYGWGRWYAEDLNDRSVRQSIAVLNPYNWRSNEEVFPDGSAITVIGIKPDPLAATYIVKETAFQDGGDPSELGASR